MKTRKIDEVYGAFIIECDKHTDERGCFQELYSTAGQYPHLIGRERQINMFCLNKSVICGLNIAPFAKLCSCIRGRIYDVIVDTRQDSLTYMNWFGVWLSGGQQIFVPANCAHGFFSEEDDTWYLHLQDGTYNSNAERQVNWRDPKIGIVWPPSQEYIISDKDKHAEML